MLEFFNAHSEVIAQIFGFIAMGIAISMYQFKKHRTILILMSLCSLVWCLHFACLGLFTPVAMNFLNVFRGIAYSFREKKWAQNNIIPGVFIVICAGSVILTWDSMWSILPFIASIFATIGSWQRNTRLLKYLSIPVCVCWFIYNIANGSIAGTLNETFVLISILVYFVRTRKEAKE
ncbi:MAG: YgjV family protein [Clostridia bacterium]|nr:YgjV family protein [Clostridia bacterium]